MTKIYESPDKGKTIYVREHGADPSTRVLYKPENNLELDPANREWEYAGDGTKIYKPEAGKLTPTEYEKK